MVIGVVLCSTVLYRLQQCSTIGAMLYNYIHLSAVLYCIILCRFVYCCSVLCNSVQLCRVLSMPSTGKQYSAVSRAGGYRLLKGDVWNAIVNK